MWSKWYKLVKFYQLNSIGVKIESLISLTNQQTKQPAIAAQGSQDQTETTQHKRVYKTSSKKKLYKLKITKGILHKLQRTIFKIEFVFFTFLPQATRPSLSRHSVTMNSGTYFHPCIQEDLIYSFLPSNSAGNKYDKF